MDIKAIENELPNWLSPKRIKHSYNTRDIAVKLGRHYQLNVEKIEKAALLHDIAKDLDLLESLKLAQKLKLTILKPEEKNPALIHAKLGTTIAAKLLKIKDKVILDSIRNHTTGTPDMDKIELVIYIADYLDPDKKQRNYDLISEIANQNIYEAALIVCTSKLEHVIESLKYINFKSIEFYHWLLDLKKKDH